MTLTNLLFPVIVPVLYTQISSTPLNLASDNEKDLVIQDLIDIVSKIIHQVVDQIKAKNFPTEKFALAKIVPIGDISGFYLVVNLKNFKCYFGQSIQMGKRRSNYRTAFSKIHKGRKLPISNPGLKNDITTNAATIDDFLWIPLLLISRRTYRFKPPTANELAKWKKREIVENKAKTVFLCAIEEPILIKLKKENKISLYNAQTGSAFVIGNKAAQKFAGTQTEKPLSIMGFAFENTKCAAIALNRDPELIPFFKSIKNSFVSELTADQWAEWDPSKKVSLENCRAFQIQHPNFYEEPNRCG